MSSSELAEEYELRQKTCWTFKWKIQESMASTKPHPLEGEAHVDKFFIGSEEEQKRGREHGKKRLVVVALEVIPGKGVGRAYARVIPDASAKSLRLLFEDHINKDAKVITDEWNGYKPLKVDYPLLEQRKSDNGANFPDLHIHIMNIKSWLRGIHHRCTKEQLQGYLDEYHFRYNRRSNMDTIFDLLIKRMVYRKPLRLNNK